MMRYQAMVPNIEHVSQSLARPLFIFYLQDYCNADVLSLHQSRVYDRIIMII